MTRRLASGREIGASPGTSNAPCWSERICDRYRRGIASTPGTRHIRCAIRMGFQRGCFSLVHHSRSATGMSLQEAALRRSPEAIAKRRPEKRKSRSDSCSHPCSNFQRFQATWPCFLCVEARTTSAGSRMMVRARGLCLDSMRLMTSSAARWPINWLF